ncbi:MULTISPECIES: hypothetical protein [Mycolicibacterium]|jgi:hypothetical protein|uniref:Uncharacterized protein n=1 Tax=Mycolicibacterium vanbaalenii (strain DSM 7251 / JCM 13017 / BCRC 16820 / KCTC 9966 / NRRL B-24157 / PYR-1) TaxID=350058 RepID=A1T3R9_MYCVP|nr:MULTISPECIES: hypothetical protein [Mycolicibacterium]ABM11819.1 hypothetical protein Mvan_0981 [Mycolicibacterium vanbaalenii PYR-1]MCV7127932.1 hypothetical protein [Mycolicibacterium vanbaalenii PYR-1]MDW5611581.1 hypothetical protein [Mycolicibacterium sp. D5.8-2]QZT57791.1 hypothetical protein JN084_04000 [Mycolicibacterium austroafricanum]QZY47129.1 hypothetical protein K5L12_05120 [Mycolicibacterium austroafricanum]
MTRGDHRRPHPFYGVALSAAALPSCWAASLITATWLAASIYVGAACAAAVGFVMTLRDLPT